jgi:hypothetical protein
LQISQAPFLFDGAASVWALALGWAREHS